VVRRAAGASVAEPGDALDRGEPHGASGGAAQRACGLVDDEVGCGEPARDERAGRPGLDQRGVSGGGQGGERRPGAVGRIRQHLHHCPSAVVGGQEPDSDDGFAGVRAAGTGERAAGDQSGVGLGEHMGLEPVEAALHRLVRVPGVGIDSGDHPVRDDLPGDPPPPVGAITALDRFDVLTGDQRQQRHSLGRPRPQLLLGQMPQ
jgi:hypothetical protein